MTAANGTSSSEFSVNVSLTMVLLLKNLSAVKPTNENKMAADTQSEIVQKILKIRNIFCKRFILWHSTYRSLCGLFCFVIYNAPWIREFLKNARKITKRFMMLINSMQKNELRNNSWCKVFVPYILSHDCFHDIYPCVTVIF